MRTLLCMLCAMLAGCLDANRVGPGAPSPQAVSADLPPDVWEHIDKVLADLPPSDPNVDVMMVNQPLVLDDLPNSGYLVGWLRSKVDYPIEQIRLDVYTHTPEGRRRDPIKVLLAYIPPRASLRFCTTYTGLPANEVVNIRAIAFPPIAATPDTVAWMIDDISRAFADGVLTVSGEIVNHNSFTIDKLQVLVEVFDPNGIQVPSPQVIKMAKLEERVKTLQPGERAKFQMTVNLDVLGLSILANQLEFYARAYGNKQPPPQTTK